MRMPRLVRLGPGGADRHGWRARRSMPCTTTMSISLARKRSAPTARAMRVAAARPFRRDTRRRGN